MINISTHQPPMVVTGRHGTREIHPCPAGSAAHRAAGPLQLCRAQRGGRPSHFSWLDPTEIHRNMPFFFQKPMISHDIPWYPTISHDIPWIIPWYAVNYLINIFIKSPNFSQSKLSFFFHIHPPERVRPPSHPSGARGSPGSLQPSTAGLGLWLQRERGSGALDLRATDWMDRWRKTMQLQLTVYPSMMICVNVHGRFSRW